MFSLFRFGQPLRVSPSLRRVSISINDLPREPKLLYISFDFCYAPALLPMSHRLCRSRVQPLQAAFAASRYPGTWGASIVRCSAFCCVAAAGLQSGGCIAFLLHVLHVPGIAHHLYAVQRVRATQAQCVLLRFAFAQLEALLCDSNSRHFICPIMLIAYC